ncbi:MAG: hypothetical protein BAJALOKI1v1_520009 [Promethearchaeota archaeon]|nr:MAG: hypothetical protein BAJALOKI1v1_520009 [Candidatus Lokiarchaeota archaeon]
MDKKNIDRMAELLRSGNTMLNYSCPECNSPIFKKKSGEMFCPSCNREVLLVENDFEREPKDNQEVKREHKNKRVNQSERSTVINETFAILETKIRWVLDKIQTETQYEMLTKYLMLLKQLYEIIQSISHTSFSMPEKL